MFNIIEEYVSNSLKRSGCSLCHGNIYEEEIDTFEEFMNRASRISTNNKQIPFIVCENDSYVNIQQIVSVKKL